MASRRGSPAMAAANPDCVRFSFGRTFMPRKWLLVPSSLVVAAAAAYGIAAFSARPAPSHPFFEADGPGALVIAHRGGAGLRPENTLAAFSHAVEIGADVLEMDIQRTADGAIVCLHDRTVDRTTDGRGRVDSLTLSELRKLDAGYNWSADGGRSHPFRGNGIQVPTLEEVFTRFPGTRMNIEMKHGGPALAQPLCTLVRRTGMGQRVLIASMNEAAIMAFRQACPEVATSMSRSEAQLFFGIQLVSLDAAYTPPVRALQIPERLGQDVIATAELVAVAHRRNLKVNVWTINDAERMEELVRIGVDGIITDRPDRLLDVVRRASTTASNKSP
jgi:glycerophosphoryl diester phosphodiesterase